MNDYIWLHFHALGSVERFWLQVCGGHQNIDAPQRQAVAVRHADNAPWMSSVRFLVTDFFTIMDVFCAPAIETAARPLSVAALLIACAVHATSWLAPPHQWSVSVASVGVASIAWLAAMSLLGSVRVGFAVYLRLALLDEEAPPRIAPRWLVRQTETILRSAGESSPNVFDVQVNQLRVTMQDFSPRDTAVTRGARLAASLVVLAGAVHYVLLCCALGRGVLVGVLGWTAVNAACFAHVAVYSAAPYLAAPACWHVNRTEPARWMAEAVVCAVFGRLIMNDESPMWFPWAASFSVAAAAAHLGQVRCRHFFLPST